MNFSLKFESELDAKSVLGAAIERCVSYGMLSVSELYDLCGIETAIYNDAFVGWTNLKEAKISVLDDNQYVLILPEPESLS